MSDLTPETLAELRRLAEAANADAVQGATYERDWPLSSRAVGQFLRALNPDLALSLLDAAAERDALAEECDGWRHLADVRAARIARVRALPVGPPSGGYYMVSMRDVRDALDADGLDPDPACLIHDVSGEDVRGWEMAECTCPTIRALDGADR